MYEGEELVRKSLGPLVGKKRIATFGGVVSTTLAVVKSVEVSANHKASIAKLCDENGAVMFVLLKGNALSSVGELVVWDTAGQKMRAVENESKAWKVAGKSDSDGQEVTVDCPACMAQISNRRIRNHFLQTHKFSIFRG